ncbi:MAG: hypothetical protein JXR48_18050 [Candidatus Delongbacteria bacterium]|nr:hypothetical protein [Candidatus Delongbacteria bacterium]MBN2836863.1 hypothetical protein [Candidatus Delongbacteria bacterium]
MIKRTLIFTTILLVIWQILISFIPLRFSLHQWQENISQAENFLFDVKNIDYLIVGSSLSKRIVINSLPEFYNLSFGGQSYLDGLNLLEIKKIMPKKIFIEVNYIDRDEDKNFQNLLTSSLMNNLKKELTFLRSDKQPLTYLSVGIKELLRVTKRSLSGNPVIQESEKEVNSKDAILEKMLILQSKNYSIIDTNNINNYLSKLKSLVNNLESRGIEIVFFEMPVNENLVHLQRTTYIRSKIINDFCNNKFIVQSDTVHYKTSDALHLTANEAEMFTMYFKGELNRIIN